MEDKNLEERKSLAKWTVECNKKYCRNQNFRTLSVIAFYAFINMAFLCAIYKVQIIPTIDLKMFLIGLVFSIVFAVISYVINSSIFIHIFVKNKEENDHINHLIKRYRELEEEAGIEKSLEERFRNGMPL